MSDQPPDSPRLTRRRLLTGGATVVIPIATASAVLRRETPWQEGAADAPVPAAGAPSGQTYLFFTAPEAAFIEAAVARLIPADDLGPGAREAGVPVFIDRQLAGSFGRAETWYMQGPWGAGESTQGYQSRLTPAGMYRAAIKAIDQQAGVESTGASFARLPADRQDDFLQRMEQGKVELQGGVNAKSFFSMLLQNTIEGFWSDPIYGGNAQMVGWRLIGFPGARYDHTPWVSQHGKPYPLPPVGLKGRPEWNKS